MNVRKVKNPPFKNVENVKVYGKIQVAVVSAQWKAVCSPLSIQLG
ncbi:hypothetical protein [Dolichospermum circinale]|nr:hypothetical protein [Dolichospermum circinale]MDB9463087.1 hypothetical protein [Dolichospermum circinale CS-541/04]MDB9546012.1 hypothetical protein [Dolichospermum circinale CS-1031]